MFCCWSSAPRYHDRMTTQTQSCTIHHHILGSSEEHTAVAKGIFQRPTKKKQGKEGTILCCFYPWRRMNLLWKRWFSLSPPLKSCQRRHHKAKSDGCKHTFSARDKIQTTSNTHTQPWLVNTVPLRPRTDTGFISRRIYNPSGLCFRKQIHKQSANVIMSCLRFKKKKQTKKTTSLAGKHLWDLWKPQNVARLMASGTDR